MKKNRYLHNQLVGTGHKREAVGVVEGLRDVLAEGVAGATGRDAPAAAVIGVGPQQVTHGTLRRKTREDEGGSADVYVVLDEACESNLPRAALPANDPVLWYDPAYQWMATGHRGGRKSGRASGKFWSDKLTTRVSLGSCSCGFKQAVALPENLPRQWAGDNQTGPWSTSKRWRCRISLGTRRRSRTLVWSVCFHGSLWESWCAPGSVPGTRGQQMHLIPSS